MNAKLNRLQQKVYDASDALATEINRQFPVGTRVRVRWGTGMMLAVVSSPSSSLQRGDVIVRTESGNVHHKHWKDISRAPLDELLPAGGLA